MGLRHISIQELTLLIIATVSAAPLDLDRKEYRQIRYQQVTAAPIPAGATGPPPLPGKSYYFQHLSNGVYWLTEGGVCNMFVVTNTGVVVADAPPGLFNSTVDAIRTVTTLPVTHQIYSHSHIDHIGESYRFGNIQRIAQWQTYNTLLGSQDPNRPLPTITFNDTLTMQIGGKTFRFDYNGPIHKIGNMFTYLPAERVLYIVDIINPGWAPFIRLALSPDVPASLRAMDKILLYPFRYLIPGHVGRLGTVQDVATMKAYLQDLQANALIASNRTTFDSIVPRVADPNNGPLLTVTYQNARIELCANLTIPKWLTILGGVDVYTPSACDAVLWSQDVDIGQRILRR